MNKMNRKKIGLQARALLLVLIITFSTTLSLTPVSAINSTLYSGAQAGSIYENATITAGGYHTCAILDDGSVRCWGYNAYGQLGDGTTTNRNTPTALSSWPSGRTAVAITADGGGHTCAILDDGSVRCWGWNDYGQLGDGTTTSRNTPTALSSWPSGRTAVAITAGGYHTCAILDDGSVRCWGSNSDGQLGDGTTTSRNTPTALSSWPSGRTAVAITAGGYHTCAILDDGSVRCWGYNSDGQLGDGTTTSRNTPTAIMWWNPSGRTVVAITAGDYHTCAIFDDGPVRCWGWNDYGQLGDGTTTSRNTPTALSSWPSGRTAVAITAGSYHTCAILDDGSVRCWGSNSDGQLGDGTTTDRNTPTTLSGWPSGRTAVAISAGYYHTCAILDDGSVRCWGYNSDGQLGDGTTTSRNTPTALSSWPSGRTAAVGDRDNDDDGLLNIFDSCANGNIGWTSGSSTDYDSDGCRDASEDLDDDNDGVLDTSDDCYRGDLNWTSDPSTDHDADGCRDAGTEDNDDDDDGVLDASDDCATGDLNWTASATTDHDSDGCQDSNEDTDDDNDGVTDTSDDCATGDLNWTPSTTTDYDSDGCQDSNEDTDDDNDGVADTSDDCATGDLNWTPSTTTDHDSDGCQDSNEDADDDNDGVSDANDFCSLGETGWTSGAVADYDGDGCRDDGEDTDDDNDGVTDTSDDCATGDLNWTPSTTTDYDSDGCQDSNEDTDDDNDGMSDIADSCPFGPLGWTSNASSDVDSDGCPDEDEDADGVVNPNDNCPDTPAGETVDGIGCSTSQLDTDSDGVSDADDACPGYNDSVDVDADGTPDGCDSLVDSDSDGVADADDQCADTMVGTDVDTGGCAIQAEGEAQAGSSSLTDQLLMGIAALLVILVLAVGVSIVLRRRPEERTG
jgi:alpha-tubulin suppressor-like RCC1 family protein